ncbi:MAG: hypothetical protein ABSC38_02450 [Verrucomicrobiia bacterium]
MNFIIINFLLEEQQAEQERARDPVKIAIAIGMSALTLVTAVSTMLWVLAVNYKAETGKLYREWQQVEAQQTKGESGSFLVVKAMADDLIELNRSRPLYAPQLALIQDLMPDSIQLTHLNLAATVEIQEQTGTPSDESGGGKPKRPSRPKMVEHMILCLEGQAVGMRPELEATAFRQMLETNAAFQVYVNKVELRSISRGATTGDGGVAGEPSADQFVIVCQYKERK